MTYRFAAGVVWLGVTACSSPPPAPVLVTTDSAGISIVQVAALPALDDTTVQWRLTLMREIRGGGAEPGEPVRIYDPNGAARFPDGTLVVFDNGPERLLVIDPLVDSVVARYGRRGSGPGEIRGDGVAIVPQGDRTFFAAELWGNRRIHRFSLDDGFMDDLPLNAISSGSGQGRSEFEIAISTFGRAGGDPTAPYVDSIARLDLTTGEASGVAPLPERSPDVSRLFGPLALWTTFASGAVITGRSDGGNFRYYSPDGRLVREMRLPLTERPVTLESIERTTREYGPYMASLGRGEDRPNYHTHHRIAIRIETIDDTTFALVHSSVSGAQEDPELAIGETAWRLFTIEGAPAGVIRFPQWFRPWSVTGDRVLGVLQDSLGTATLREYLLEAPAPVARRD